MIVDAFLYAGETSMLELRLRTLADVVDLFLPVGCSITHQSQPAEPIHGSVAEALHRLSADGVITDYARTRLSSADCAVSVRSYTVEVAPARTRGGVGTADYQQIERQHRDGIVAACDAADVPDDAVVLVSDVDEIPDPFSVQHAAEQLAQLGEPWAVVFEQRFHSTALDLLHPQQPWLGTTAALRSGLAPQRMRDDRGLLREIGLVAERAGWHFSWFGTDAERQRKLDTFSHAELRGRFDPAVARERLEHSNGEPLRRTSVGEMRSLDWPAPIVDGTFVPPTHWFSGEAGYVALGQALRE